MRDSFNGAINPVTFSLVGAASFFVNNPGTSFSDAE